MLANVSSIANVIFWFTLFEAPWVENDTKQKEIKA